MSYQDDIGRNHEGLKPEDKGQFPRSSEEDYASSSGGEDLDLLHEDEQLNKLQNQQRRQRRKAYEKESALQGKKQSWLVGIRRCLRPRKTCLIITAILVGGVILLIGGSGVWVYKTAPIDGESPAWYPSPQGGTLEEWGESFQKAEIMVKKMSVVEKVNITTGTGWSQDLCVGNTAPAIHARFPALCLQDGPLSIRFADHITAFPAGITVGATWNKNLMYERGRAQGLEARRKGVNVLLGPSMGPLGRMPAGGRNWEGFGPDPVLQGIAAAETIRGIQDEGVMATAKHYILNEQEHFRQSFEWGLPNAISSNIDDRALHEVYLWPFAESIRAGVASVMCSYNQVNNSYACGNSKLLNGILKDELGFQGFVQSDWLAQRSGVASSLAGLDMTMPGDGLTWMNGDSLWGPYLTEAALNGSLPMDRLDDMVTRIVAAWYQLGQDDESRWPMAPPLGDGGPNFSSWTDDEIGFIHHGSDDKTKAVVNKFIDAQGEGADFHGHLAKKIAAEGTILVKNENNILPLSRKGPPIKSGSSTNAKYQVGIFGEDAGPGRGPNVCADRGCNQGTLAQGWGSGAVEFPYLVTPVKALESAFDFDFVNITTYLTNDPPSKKSPSAVVNQDLCLVFVNSDGGEGYIVSDGIRGDRNDLYPQKGGDKLVKDVATNCGNGTGQTIVVVHAVGPVILEHWVDLPGVKAVLLANLPGEESGNALADVLFGDDDASGRLPYTIAKSLGHYGEAGQILYYPNAIVPQQDFKEGLYIEHRHFDKHNIEPRYEFGFGLSYTSFTYSNLTLTTLNPKSLLPDPRPENSHSPPTYNSPIPDPASALFPPSFRKLKNYIYPYISSTSSIHHGPYPYPPGYYTPQPPSPAGGAQGGNPSLYTPHLLANLTLTNSGSRPGKAVVQLYLSFPSGVTEPETGDAIDFPPRVLRAFEKVALDMGESCQVSLPLTRKDLSYWSVVRQNWVMPTEGLFTVGVGASSRDVRVEGRW